MYLKGAAYLEALIFKRNPIPFWVSSCAQKFAVKARYLHGFPGQHPLAQTRKRDILL